MTVKLINPPSSSSSSTTSAINIDQHVIAASFVITAGYSAYLSRYIEIASGITLEIGSDADLEIG